MSLKKKTKKVLSNVLPNGDFKEIAKNFWYNLFSNRNVKFKLIRRKQSNLIFETFYKNHTFLTYQPLYNIILDFDYYQHYYKVKRGDVIIDGGSNIGILSLLFAKLVGVKGKVFSFEPDKYNIKEMRSNFRLNNMTDSLNIQEDLIWSSEDLIDFQESGTVASSAFWFSDETNIVKKKTISLDKWIIKNGVNRLDYIKMDIEGAELEAIKGCKEIILKYQPNFAIASYHVINNEPTYVKLEEFFKEMNYPYITKKFNSYEIITFAGPAINDKKSF